MPLFQFHNRIRTQLLIISKIKFSITNIITRGSVYESCSFFFGSLVKRERFNYDRLSDHDKNEIASIYVTEYEIEIPESYDLTSATKLLMDLNNGDIESPQYDPCFGFLDTTHTRETIIK